MSVGDNPRMKRTVTVAVALLGTCAATGAGAAFGQVGIGGGGIGTPDPPVIKDATCSTRCLGLRIVTESGKVELTGTGLGGVDKVRFPGRGDNLTVAPVTATDSAVTAVVPTGAGDGRIYVTNVAGQRAASPVDIEVEPKSAIEDVEGFKIKSAEAVPPKAYFDSAKGSEVDYLFAADGAADVRVDVVNKKTGEKVDSAVQEDMEPFANHSFTWDGLNAQNGVARNGDYKFEVSPLAGGAGAGAGFAYHDHIFPLRGNHKYGDGLGAGRGHQGQDVFAKCGTKIVAARGGRVQVSAYHSAAGNYVVIDGQKTGRDYVYMHMEARGRPREGSRVHTGDVIGYESDTGRASGCHLHFELWSAPGWYEGGRVLNPTVPLKKWDKYS